MNADLLTSREMNGVAPTEQAKQAIRHVLEQAYSRPHWGWYLGLGTQSFGLLTEALATLTDEPDLGKVRESWACTNAVNPAEDPDLRERALELAKDEWEPSRGDLFEHINCLSIAERLELLDDLRTRCCFHCGAQIPIRPCGCHLTHGSEVPK